MTTPRPQKAGFFDDDRNRPPSVSLDVALSDHHVLDGIRANRHVHLGDPVFLARTRRRCSVEPAAAGTAPRGPQVNPAVECVDVQLTQWAVAGRTWVASRCDDLGAPYTALC